MLYDPNPAGATGPAERGRGVPEFWRLIAALDIGNVDPGGTLRM